MEIGNWKFWSSKCQQASMIGRVATKFDESKMENNRQANFDFFDFSHDSAKQASLMALAAPKVQLSTFNFAKQPPHLAPQK